GILFNSVASGVITDAITATDTDIVNALNVGANTITGAGYLITSTASGLTLNSTSADLALTTTTSGSISLTPAGSTSDIVLSLIDNNTDALDIQQGTSNYFNINTTDGSEAITINPSGVGHTYGMTITSDLTNGARSTDLLTITQASNGTFDNTANLFQLTNADTGSTTAIMDISQSASGTALNFSTLGTTSTAIAIGSTNAFPGAAQGIVINAGSLTTGTAINISSNITGAIPAFTNDFFQMRPLRTKDSGATTITDSGNYMDIQRNNTVNVSGGTFNVSGDLVTLSTNLTETLGSITDTSNILALAQNCGTNVDCTGAVLDIVNAGTGQGVLLTSSSTGDLMQLDSSGAVTTANGILVQATNVSGVITDAVDVSDAEIVNALNIGANFILGNGIRAFSSSSTVWTFEDTSANDLITITDAGTAGTLTVSGSTGFLDLGGITHATTDVQGLKLPQNTTLSNPVSGEGYLAYDTDNDAIYMYTSGGGWTNVSGASTTLQNAYDNGNSITTTTNRDIDFILADVATDPNFDIDIVADNTVSISRTDNASTEIPSQLLLLENLDTNMTITDGILYNVAAGGVITDAIDATDADIVNALNVGANTITGTSYTITAGTALALGDGTPTVAIDSSDWDITTVGNMSGIGTIAADGNITLTKADPSLILNVSTATDTDFWLGVVDDGGTDDDDLFIIGDGTAPGSGNFFAINTSGLVGIGTTAPGAYLNAYSTGSTATMGLFDWSPSSATTSPSDLFRINIGTNGTTSGNIFDVEDTSSSVFSISETAITSALPHSFTAAGDVSMAYDLNFTNQTASYIKSNAPLYIQTGESFENNNLTLQMYGTGQAITELGTGYAKVSSTSTSVDGATSTNINLAGLLVTTGDLDTISLLVRNTNTGQIDMANVGTEAAAQADPGVLTVEGAGSSTPGYNLITAYNSLTRSDAASVFRVRADGTVYGEATFQTTGADLAEFFEKEEPIADSEIAGMNKATGKLRKYRAGDTVIGIVTSTPAFVGNYPKGATDEEFANRYALVGLTGQILVSVTTENGSISIGDHIMPSAKKPGIGVKSISAGAVVGKALQSYTSSDKNKVGTILAYVSPQWYAPDPLVMQINELGSITTQYTNELLDARFANIDRTLGINTTNTAPELIAQNDAATITQTLTARVASTEEKIASLETRLSALEALESSASSQQNTATTTQDSSSGIYTSYVITEATDSAKLSDIENLQFEIDSLKNTVALLTGSALEGTQSALQATTESSTSATPFANTLNDLEVLNILKATGELTVAGKTKLADANIAGSLTVGLLTISDTDTSINTLSEPLKIQNQSLADVDFFKGSVVISKTGNIQASGEVKAASISTAELKIISSEQNQTTPDTQATVGSATIKAGETQVKISNSKVATTSKIFFSPTRQTDKVLYVLNKMEGREFTVGIAQSANEDITFDWWIVN
ncbi:MAG: peptidase G2 autoproteolytic cleavage domain-containing protein, partial [Patescibacteria group bacterium]